MSVPPLPTPAPVRRLALFPCRGAQVSCSSLEEPCVSSSMALLSPPPSLPSGRSHSDLRHVVRAHPTAPQPGAPLWPVVWLLEGLLCFGPTHPWPAGHPRGPLCMAPSPAPSGFSLPGPEVASPSVPPASSELQHPERDAARKGRLGRVAAAVRACVSVRVSQDKQACSVCGPSCLLSPFPASPLRARAA